VKLEEIKNSLEKLQKDFNSQLIALGSDREDFHNSLIDLTSKYPEHKELIQFIVYVNDKLETKQSMFTDMVSDSFNEIVALKKNLLYKMIDDNTGNSNKATTQGFWGGIMSKIKTFKDIKIILVTIAIITATIGVILAPDTFLEVIRNLVKIIL